MMITYRKLKNALKRTSYIDEIRWLMKDNDGNMPSRSDIEQKMGSGKCPSLARKYRLRYGSPSVYFNSLEFGKNGISIFIPNSLLSTGGYERGSKLSVNIRGDRIEFITNKPEDTPPITLLDTNINPNAAFKDRCPEPEEEVRCPEEEIECYKCGKFFKPTEIKSAPCARDRGWRVLCNTCYDIWLNKDWRIF